MLELTKKAQGIEWKKELRHNQLQILLLPPHGSSVMLGKTLDLSVPQFMPLWGGNNDILTSVLGRMERINMHNTNCQGLAPSEDFILNNVIT